jgi:hypothetical protein
MSTIFLEHRRVLRRDYPGKEWATAQKCGSYVRSDEAPLASHLQNSENVIYEDSSSPTIRNLSKGDL